MFSSRTSRSGKCRLSVIRGRLLLDHGTDDHLPVAMAGAEHFSRVMGRRQAGHRKEEPLVLRWRGNEGQSAAPVALRAEAVRLTPTDEKTVSRGCAENLIAPSEKEAALCYLKNLVFSRGDVRRRAQPPGDRHQHQGERSLLLRTEKYLRLDTGKVRRVKCRQYRRRVP